eukprot:4575078-Amphidinium_carterae.1
MAGMIQMSLKLLAWYCCGCWSLAIGPDRGSLSSSTSSWEPLGASRALAMHLTWAVNSSNDCK